ncbi:MAG: class I SAM-dependent methyltransferase [Bacillota bacterium]
MKNPFRQVPLYNFLFYCNQHELDKSVLDCGAGGMRPPLALFAEYGYKTYGIDIDDRQLEKARQYEEENNLKLNIIKGDMKSIMLDDQSVSFAYSYNSIFHMPKKEIAEALREIRRVLKPGGYCFVNFVSTDDMGFGEGEKAGEGEYIQNEEGETILHSYFDIDEAESYFVGFDVIFKERRIREGFMNDGEKVKLGYIDYILEKK